jgi:hypothetical protein
VVYSVFYYASEALTRAIVGFMLKLYQRMQARRMVEEKPKKPEIRPPTWGWFETTNMHGDKELVYVPRHSPGLRVSIPVLDIKKPTRAWPGKPPVRLMFTYREAASKNWFEEIERLAELVEKGEGQAS